MCNASSPARSDLRVGTPTTCAGRSRISATGRPRGRRDGGFTLVEVIVVTALLAIALLGTLCAVVSAKSLERRLQVQNAAQGAARDTIEQIRNGDPAAQLTWYQAHPTFTANGQSVTVSFPAAALTEAFPKLDPATTCFADTNQDGQIDNNPANASAPGILPVRVVVGAGPSQVFLEAMVIKR